MKPIILLAASGLALSACTLGQEDYGELETGANPAPDLQGVWNLTSAVQVDMVAEERGYPQFATELDITERFSYDDVEVTFNLDEAGLPSDFTAQLGDAPNIFGSASGDWTFDILASNESVDSLLVAEGFILAETLQFNGGATELTIGSLANVGLGQLVLSQIYYLVEGEERSGIIRYDYTFQKEESLEEL